MPAMPAWCPQCNEMVDGAGGIYIEGGTHTLADNIVSCPRGHRARVIEGEFSVQDGIIDVIQASPWTRAKLAEFQSALQWASENFKSDPAAAVERIAEVNPSFGAMLTTFLASPYAPLVYFLIMTALSLCMWLIPQAPDAPANDPLPITPQQINQFFINAPNLDVQLPDPSPPSPGGSSAPPPPG